MMVIGVVNSFTRFFSRPVETHLIQKVSESLPFPAITFCNENPVRFSAMAKAYPDFLKNVSSLQLIHFVLSFIHILLQFIPPFNVILNQI